MANVYVIVQQLNVVFDCGPSPPVIAFVVVDSGLFTAMCKKYAAFFTGRKTLVLSASFGRNTLDITMGVFGLCIFY